MYTCKMSGWSCGRLSLLTTSRGPCREPVSQSTVMEHQLYTRTTHPTTHTHLHIVNVELYFAILPNVHVDGGNVAGHYEDCPRRVVRCCVLPSGLDVTPMAQITHGNCSELLGGASRLNSLFTHGVPANTTCVCISRKNAQTLRRFVSAHHRSRGLPMVTGRHCRFSQLLVTFLNAGVTFRHRTVFGYEKRCTRWLLVKTCMLHAKSLQFVYALHSGAAAFIPQP